MGDTSTLMTYLMQKCKILSFNPSRYFNGVCVAIQMALTTKNILLAQSKLHMPDKVLGKNFHALPETATVWLSLTLGQYFDK